MKRRTQRGGMNRFRGNTRENRHNHPKNQNSVQTKDQQYSSPKIYTWNVQKKGSPEEIDKVIVDSIKPADFPHIICLQEANLPASGTETTSFKWFCEGTVGLAFLVNKSRFFSDKKIADIGKFESICDQIKTLEVIVKDECLVKVIGCHIPPAADLLSHELWGKLSDTLKAIPLDQLYMLVGDFNAQIGKSEFITTSFSRSFGAMLFHSVSNENGQHLKDLVLPAHMRVLSLIRSPRSNYLDAEKCYTYKSGESCSQQSYIIGSHSLSSNSNAYLRRPESYDHAILGCMVKIPLIKLEDQNKRHPLVCTWNTKGITPAKVDSILKAYNFPIVCVQEVFLTSEQDILTDNYTWLCSKSMWAKNVGILVKKLPNISVEKFEAVSDSLCVADLSIDGKPLKVISCHLPVKSNPKNAAVTGQLCELVKGIPKETFFVLAGDFNIKSSFKDPEDGNDTFFSEFVKDANLCMEETLDIHKKMLYMTSVVSKSVTGSPNQILIPLTFRDQKDPKLFVKWVPFIENGIISMITNENKGEGKKKTHEVAEEGKQSYKVAVVNGVSYKITTSEYFEPGDFDKLPPLSEETLEKFKNSPPNAEELGKLLEGFVIFQDFNTSSNSLPFNLLLKSFKEGKKFGGFTLEDHTTPPTNSSQIKSSRARTMKICWNGIVLEEMKVEEGHFFRVKSKLASSVLRKLHETCYWIKCKKSYYNDGFEPMAKYVPKINEVIRKVEEKDLKSEDSILSFIDEFFAKDTDVELVFGPEFQDHFKAIVSCASEKDLKIRFFTSHEKPKNTRDDHIAISKRRTPQEIKDKLLKDAEDVRYILIPPCGLGKDSLKFTETYLKEIIKRENKISSSFWNETKKPNQPKSNPEKAATPAQGKKTPQQQQKTEQQPNQVRTRPPTQQQSLNQRRNNQTTRAPFQRQSTQVARPNQATRQISQYDRKRKFQYDQNPPVPLRDVRPFEHRLQPWSAGAEPYNNSPWMSSQEVQRPRGTDRYDITAARNDRRVSQGPWANESRPTISPWNANGGTSHDREMSFQARSYPREELLYERRAPNDRDQYERELELAERNINRDDGRYDRRSGYELNERSRDYQTDYPEVKRQRMESAEVSPGVAPPVWSSVDPLVLVWPITVDSKLEDRAKEILAANFHVEYQQIDRFTEAAFVSLPMRNGMKKSFCLGVGRDQSSAAVSALNLLIRNSTVIKPTTSFLCNGATPNFVRYKIPCQTNPRTYIILTKNDTGSLSNPRLVEILNTFKGSFNDDVFFDKDSYTLGEKESIMSIASQLGLSVRHFGDSFNMANRYVCVYKVKPQNQLLEEVFRARGNHPKYVVCDDK